MEQKSPSKSELNHEPVVEDNTSQVIGPSGLHQMPAKQENKKVKLILWIIIFILLIALAIGLAYLAQFLFLLYVVTNL